jgi:hypothetical protein
MKMTYCWSFQEKILVYDVGQIRTCAQFLLGVLYAFSGLRLMSVYGANRRCSTTLMFADKFIRVFQKKRKNKQNNNIEILITQLDCLSSELYTNTTTGLIFLDATFFSMLFISGTTQKNRKIGGPASGCHPHGKIS